MNDSAALFLIDLRRKNRQASDQPVSIESVGRGLIARLTLNDNKGQPEHFMCYGTTFREALLDLHIEVTRWADQQLEDESDEDDETEEESTR